VYTFLDQTAKRVPDRIAIIFGGMELTYSELKNLCYRFASALADMGVRKGDRVAINLPNCPQFAIAYYAALRLGAVFSPLSPLLSPREVEYQLNDCGAQTLVSLDLIYPGIESAIPKTGVKNVITTSIADCYNPIISPLKLIGKIEVPNTIDMAPLLSNYEPFDKDVDIDAKKDLAHLAYTGGTTGLSKGVMLTHLNVFTNVLQYLHWGNGSHTEIVNGVMTTIYPEEIDPADRVSLQDKEIALVVVPWFHAMGTVGYLNMLIAGGTTMVVFPRFEPLEYIGAVVKYQATALGGAPQLYIPLINLPDFDSYDLSSVKVAASGAAPLPVAVMEKLQDAFSEGYVSEGYGLTECTMGATSNPSGRGNGRLGSVGLPVFDTEVKIVDLNTGDELPPEKEGEVLIKGPQVMQGYYNKPEATAEVLKDGWLYTGDIGKMDKDGFVYITDRLKDMIIYKGYNVYPRELEELLFKHPSVEHCAVVGRPDMEAGETPVAFVKLISGQETTKQEISEFVNAQVAAYKKIRDIIFIDDIPVSGAGKVLKRELRKRFEQK
ncbi:MAG: AMP-binding protein, partial [Desulfobacterales bacterium]|nr:AMP-binding protein [Desulfobacterales bacterium]